jgi:hypothetical protein
VTPAQFSPDKQQVVTASAPMDRVGASQECGAMIGRRNIPVRLFPSSTVENGSKTEPRGVEGYPALTEKVEQTREMNTN